VYRNAPESAAVQSQVLARTALIDLVRDVARSGVTLAELLRVLGTKLDVDEHLANEAVDILLGSGVLMSEPRSHLARFDDSVLIEQYGKSSAERAARVAAVTSSVASVDGTPLARQRDADYYALRNAIEAAFGKSDHYFQTDTKLVVSGTLGGNVLNDAALL